MKLGEAFKEAEALVEQWELDKCKVKFEDHKTTCGKLRWFPKITKGNQCVLFLSRNYVLNNPDDRVLNTFKHEIAHGLDLQRNNGMLEKARGGKNLPHGARWKKVAIEVGADPVACAKDAYIPRRFVVVCKKCANSFERDKRPDLNGRVCAKCKQNDFEVRFNPAFRKEGSLLVEKELT